jgi:hypothetical protein
MSNHDFMVRIVSDGLLKHKRASLENKPSTRSSEDPHLCVNVNWKRRSGWVESQALDRFGINHPERGPFYTQAAT